MKSKGLDYEAIGRNIRRLRRERGHTQRELARLAGTSKSQISRLERGGCMTVRTFFALCRALNCSARELLQDAE